MPSFAYLGSDLPEDELLVPTQTGQPPYTQPLGVRPPPTDPTERAIDRYDRATANLSAGRTRPGTQMRRLVEGRDRLFSAVEGSRAIRGGASRQMDPDVQRVIDAAVQHGGYRWPVNRDMTAADWEALVNAAGNSSAPNFGGDADTLIMMEMLGTVGAANRFEVDQYATGGARLGHRILPPRISSAGPLQPLVTGPGTTTPFVGNTARLYSNEEMDVVRRLSRHNYAPEVVDRIFAEDRELLPRLLSDALLQATNPEERQLIEEMAQDYYVTLTRPDVTQPAGKVGTAQPLSRTPVGEPKIRYKRDEGGPTEEQIEEQLRFRPDRP